MDTSKNPWGTDHPLVSVIIPTHDGADLTELIRSLRKSSYPYFETIVVNEGLERSKQRNIGIKRAKGKYLLFLDSDMAISTNLLKECVELIQTCNGIYLPERIMTKGLFGRIRDFERQFYNGTAVDSVRFVRAYRCPKFDETMSGPEDSDWDRRILGVKKTSDNVVYHYDNVNFLSYCKKKLYYTKSMRRFAEKNPEDKILNMKYRCFTVFTENGKWKRLLDHPFLTVGVLLILFIRGIIYLTK